MTRQWRKEKQSELAKPGFVWTYGHYLTLIFHTLCRGGVLLSGVRTSFFFKWHLKLRLLRGHNYIRQYTINGRTVSSVGFAVIMMGFLRVKQLMIFGNSGLRGLPTRVTLFL